MIIMTDNDYTEDGRRSGEALVSHSTKTGENDVTKNADELKKNAVDNEPERFV